MEHIDQMDEIKEPKRPTFLKVLCILTFVNTGFGLLGVLMGFMSGPQSSEGLEKSAADLVRLGNDAREQGMSGIAHMFDQLVDMSYHINEHFYGNLLMALFITATGFAGAFLMWQGRKLGFHAYIVYNLLQIVIIYLWVPVESVPIVSPIFGSIMSGLFIFMYSRNLKWMR